MTYFGDFLWQTNGPQTLRPQEITHIENLTAFSASIPNLSAAWICRNRLSLQEGSYLHIVILPSQASYKVSYEPTQKLDKFAFSLVIAAAVLSHWLKLLVCFAPL